MPDELARLRRRVFGPPPQAAEALADLWRTVFGQPPPVTGATDLLTRVLVQSLPNAPPYRPAPPQPAAGTPTATPEEADAEHR